MTTPTFLFVDGVKPDRDTLREIRSHAMRGKNAGRVLPPRQPRKPRQDRTRPTSQKKKRLQPALHDGGACIVLDPVGSSLSNAMRTQRFPVELTPAALQVVTKYFCYVMEKLYPPKLGLQVDMYHAVWLQTLLADEAALHCGLALMEACNDLFCGSSCGKAAPLSPEGMRHLSQGLALVNQRLAGRDALSDATFCLIVLMIVHEQVCRKEAAAEIHFQGLAKMVALRGGLDKLETADRFIALKICKLDMSSAWQSGRPLHFFRHNMTAVRQELFDKGVGQYWSIPVAAVDALRHDRPLLRPELADILADAYHVAGFLNTAPAAGHTIRIHTFQEMTVSLCGRLIQLGPPRIGDGDDCRPGSGTNTHVDATYHMGLTLFSMMLSLQLDRHRVLNYPLITRRLRSVLLLDIRSADPRLRLWVLILGAIWVQGEDSGDDNTWLALELEETTQQLGITGGWPQVHSAVRVFPWVDALQNKVGQDAWGWFHKKRRDSIL